MSQLNAFLFISLDGYYKDSVERMDWHEHNQEGNSLSIDGLSQGNTLLFGRKTYDLMSSFWPTAMAATQFPEVANGMNEAKKIVISAKLQSATWNNTSVLDKNWINAVQVLKQKQNITVLGSGTIITQLVDAKLLDNISLLIDPIALGKGTSIFHQINTIQKLKLMDTKNFSNGSILANYKLLY